MGCIPNLTIMSPSDEIELKNMVMTCAAFDDGPTVLRYPRGVGYGADKLTTLFGYDLENGEIPQKGVFFCCEWVNHCVFVHAASNLLIVIST
jgi:1-deoxy-D-xylulose-5-phosphate synthase